VKNATQEQLIAPWTNAFSGGCPDVKPSLDLDEFRTKAVAKCFGSKCEMTNTEGMHFL
jgi:hypothetical protein